MLDNKEIWKDCKGYEKLYQVSNMGRVWSIRKQRIIKAFENQYGYLEITLTTKNGKKKYERVHRLVALAFCNKPDNCTVVNHLNGNKLDNRAENLEWTTIRGNTKHAYDNNLGHMKDTQLKAAKLGADKSRYTIKVYKNSNLIGVFDGQENCAKELGINARTIYNCVKEDRMSRDGYSFVIYKEGDAA